MIRSGRLIPATTLAVISLSLSSLGAQATAKPTEYQVKAAYLYNFGRFVEWRTSADTNDFGICVIGRDPFGQSLESAVAGETINGKSIVTRRLSNPAEAVGCRILFISASEETRLSQILSIVQKGSVLTVSDMQGFADRGGMVQFIQQGSRVRFAINLAVAERAGLSLSSELLRVATSVRGGA